MKRSKAFYAATIFAMIALTAGFVLGAITLTNSSQNAQGNYVNASGAVAGLAYASTVLNATPSAGMTAYTGTAAAPQAYAGGFVRYCADTTPCVAGDFAQTISYTVTAPLTGSFQVVVVVTASAGGGTNTIYLKSAGGLTGTIQLFWDLGTASATITAVTITAQQCSGATCP
jgi:hypothetical protein